MTRLASFAGVFALAFVVCTLLYPVVLPFYEGMARHATNVTLTLSGQHLVVANAAPDGWEVERILVGGELRPAFGIPSSSLKYINLGIVLLPALIVATPVPSWSGRLRVLVVGWLALFVVQVLLHAAFISSWAHYKQFNPTSVISGWIMIAHSSSGQFLPAAVWIGLTWRTWFGQESGWDEARPNAPCVCGSRRKFKHCCGKPAARRRQRGAGQEA